MWEDGGCLGKIYELRQVCEREMVVDVGLQASSALGCYVRHALWVCGRSECWRDDSSAGIKGAGDSILAYMRC